MSNRLFLGLAALSTLSSPAAALDFGNGFSVVGDVELEYFNDGSSDSSNAFGDVTLGWRSQAGGAIGFGFDLNPVGVASLDGDDSLSTFWGGLVLTTAAGEVTVGNPRPLLKTMIKTPELGGTRLYELFIGEIYSSTLEIAGLQSSKQLYGISFKGGTGALKYGASYHTVDGSPVNIVELAGTYQAGQTLIQGGIELIDASGNQTDKYLIGATYAADRWSAGLLLTSVKGPFISFTITNLFGDYAVTDALTVGAQVFRLEGAGSPITLYGVSGEYGFGSGGFAQLGVVDSDSGGDPTYSASVGYRF